MWPTPQHCTLLFSAPYSFQLTFSSPTVIIDMVKCERKRRKSISSALSSTLIKKLFVSLTNVMCHRVSTQSSTHYWVSMSPISRSSILAAKNEEWKWREKIDREVLLLLLLMRFHRPSKKKWNFFFSPLRVDYLFGNVRESLKIELWNKNPIKRFFAVALELN